MIATGWVFAPYSCECDNRDKLTNDWCVDAALGTITPAAIGVAIIFVVAILITLCGFDIIKHFKFFAITFFVLAFPLGFLGFFLLPIEAYWSILW